MQLHLRRVGLEARPDLVRGTPKDDGAGSNPSEKNDEKEDPDNPPKDDGGNTESPSTESQLPTAPESSESRSIDDPPLSNAKFCLIGQQNIMQQPCALMRKQQTMAADTHLQFALEILVLYLVGSLYITSNYCGKFRQLV